MTDKPKEQYLFFAFFIAMFIIFGLLLWIIMRKPQTVVVSDKEKVLRDSIAMLKSNMDQSLLRQGKLQHQYDSLAAIGPGVIYRNHETTKFIFNSASPNQLDSIIRAAWSIKGY